MVGPIRPTVLRNRHFLLLWSAQAISQTAQNVIVIALLVEVGRLTASSVQHSLLVLSFIVPAALLGPLAGVLVDRVDKRSVLALTNFLRAGAVLAYTVIGPTWPIGRALAALYLLSALFSAISQFFAPAEASTIPLLVHGSQLAVANSLFELTLISSQVIGFSILGPVLIKLTTPHALFLVVSSLYLVCALLVALLPALPPGEREARPSGLSDELRRAWREMREIWSFIARERAVAMAIVDLALTTSIFLMLGTLGVGLVSKVMGLPSSDLAYLMASGGQRARVGAGARAPGSLPVRQRHARRRRAGRDGGEHRRNGLRRPGLASAGW